MGNGGEFRVGKREGYGCETGRLWVGKGGELRVGKGGDFREGYGV